MAEPPDELPSGDRELLKLRAESLYNLGQLPEALAAYERYVERQPRDTSAWKRLAELALELGDADRAKQASMQTIDVMRPDPDQMKLQGRAEAGLGEHRRARETFELALDERQDDPEILRLLGTEQAALGEHHDAVESFRRAIEGGAGAVAQLGLAGSLLELFKHDQAIELLKGLPPDFMVNKLLAKALRQGQQRGEALKAISAATEYDEADAETWKLEGLLLQEGQEHEAALDSFLKARKLDDSDAETWKLQGQSLEALGRSEEAVASYDRGLELGGAGAAPAVPPVLDDAIARPGAEPEPTDRSVTTEPGRDPDSRGAARETPDWGGPDGETPDYGKASAERPNVDEEQAVSRVLTHRRPDDPEMFKGQQASGGQPDGSESPEPEPEPEPTNALDIKPRMFSDQATAEDSLGFRPLVKGLATLLNSKDTSLPLAIAVTAPWGAGKSSVMLQLQDELRDPKPAGDNDRRWHIVCLDAWKYEKSERLWAALAKAIYDQPFKGDWRGRAKFVLNVEWRRLGGWKQAGLLLFGLLAAVATAGLGFRILDPLAAAVAWLPGLLALAGL